MCNGYPHGYWGYDSQVMHILMCTGDMTQIYCKYESRVMLIIMGTEEMTQRY